MINPIPDRSDFAAIAQQHFYRTGMAVEAGVFRGEFSAHNLKHWKGWYYMVDTWAHRPGDGQDKNDEDAGHWSAVINDARRATRFAEDRRELIREYSVAAAEKFKDGSLDWVFIDAGHDYQNCLADLVAWWPKLRPGGLFSGDDYGAGRDDPAVLPLTAERFSLKHGATAMEYDWGTAKALSEFCAARGLRVNVTWLNDIHNPAWWIIKPKQ